MLPNCVLDRGNSAVLAGFGTWYLILLCVVAVVIMLTAQERSRGIVVRASTSISFPCADTGSIRRGQISGVLGLSPSKMRPYITWLVSSVRAPCILTAWRSRQARWIGFVSAMPEPPQAR